MPTDDKNLLGSTIAREAAEADLALAVVAVARNEVALVVIPPNVPKQHASDLK